MTNKEPENTTIEIIDENGNTIYCELFNIVEYNGQEYALLLPSDQKDNEESEFVLMKIEENGDDISFINLSDAEFQEVAEYIENISDDEE